MIPKVRTHMVLVPIPLEQRKKMMTSTFHSMKTSSSIYRTKYKICKNEVGVTNGDNDNEVSN